jgi:FkbM family methyltransferase
MLTKLRSIFRPEYIFRPSQLWRRLRHSLNPPSGHVRAMTPCGLPLIVNASELNGRAVLTLGIYDLRVSEMLHRIVQPGDCAIDIGANIGVMTSLMARRAGVRGRVYGIEPHPGTRKLLVESAALWANSSLACAKVEVLPLGMSSRSGSAFLEEPEGFVTNCGLARILRNAEQGLRQARAIEVRTFEEVFGDGRKVRLVKLDVEGHEDEVFSGMRDSLASGSVQFIIFEEFRPLPSLACDMLKEAGYSTYLIDRNFWGPKLVPTFQRPKQIIGETTNVLAVRSDENLARLTEAGWRCLRSRGA